MPSESGERRPTRPQNSVGSLLPQPPKSSEPLPCPRCESTSTKFCYYNNYNLSQPRHFCKSCRRYWTQGGTLRNVPVGGGSRKNSKRSRSSSATSSSSSSSSTLTHEPDHVPITANPVSVIHGVKVEMGSNDLNMNESANFTTLLNSQGGGLLGLGGYGFGHGSGFEDMGFAFGRGVWPVQGMDYLGTGGGNAVGAVPGCNTWQTNEDEGGGAGAGTGGLVDGDCFAWPGLAISTPRKGLK